MINIHQKLTDENWKSKMLFKFTMNWYLMYNDELEKSNRWLNTKWNKLSN
jgi:hypothetical protein